MIAAKTVRSGDRVRDKHLGVVWVVIAHEGEGAVQVERNGVRTSVSMWDLELVTDRTSQKSSQ
jgi:hypothetical protein